MLTAKQVDSQASRNDKLKNKYTNIDSANILAWWTNFMAKPNLGLMITWIRMVVSAEIAKTFAL